MRCRAILVLMLVSLPVVAQSSTAADPVKAACGEADRTFKVTNHAARDESALLPDEGRIYLIEVQDRVAFCPGGCGVTIKVGLDGVWAGATSGNSYLDMVPKAGVHHLCVAWQSKLRGRRKNEQLAMLTVKSGDTLYYRVHLTPSTPDTIAHFELEPVNTDEGKLLVTRFPQSSWVAK